MGRKRGTKQPRRSFRKKEVKSMKPLHRKPVNKYHSAKKFRKQASKTKGANVSPSPMRGGIRL